jgi:polyphosphate kinase
LDTGELYLNRELSWLAFNERVLAEAVNASLPIYERLKFLCIAASNLDEFFMIRVAGLKKQVLSGSAGTSDDGMPPAVQLQRISERTHAMVEQMYRCWRELLMPALESTGTRILEEAQMAPEQREAAQTHFLSSVFPALTPLAVDPAHPFPHLRNKSINVAVLLRPKEKDKEEEQETKVIERDRGGERLVGGGADADRARAPGAAAGRRQAWRAIVFAPLRVDSRARRRVVPRFRRASDGGVPPDPQLGPRGRRG